MRTVVIAIAAVVLCGASGSAQTLPDWSGVWAMQGGTIFDRATVKPPNAGANDPVTPREYPPYNAEWEAKYVANNERAKKGVFPDPGTTCGTPAGFPRLMNVPDTYEFAVTPKAVWILTENGPNTMRIYTDGRKFPPADELWGTYTGASIGHWEGDTLVFATLALKGSKDGDQILDRTGLILSDAARVTTRMRKVDDMTLEAVMTIEDATALTKPWVVTKRYRKQPPNTWVWDYACAENNRNPVSPSGRTLTIGPDGKIIDKVVD
ncbi:MAG: hypothetical protein FJW14_04860 [Acidimicrobiia bacterium]|nr:hypothetical protein [Acidimicrobiia bacterium]